MNILERLQAKRRGAKNDYLLVKGQLKGAAFLQMFVDYPPSQPPSKECASK
jgi:hypothetical protein